MALLPSDPKAQKQLLLGVLPLAILVLYWYFVHGKAKEEIAAAEQRLETLETKNAAARAIAARGGPELEKKLAMYEEHMARLEELIPRGEEVPELLHAMELRARESAVDLALLRPEAETPMDYYSKQTYAMSVIGVYHDVGRFLAAIGSLPRIVTPVDLRLTPRKETDNEGRLKLEAQFKIQTYILPARAPVERRSDATT
ncbi:MAG TPA: type 4a pilus biogenesis protein PilO [Longimicrobiales bacterium]